MYAIRSYYGIHGSVPPEAFGKGNALLALGEEGPEGLEVLHLRANFLVGDGADHVARGVFDEERPGENVSGVGDLP